MKLSTRFNGKTITTADGFRNFDGVWHFQFDAIRMLQGVHVTTIIFEFEGNVMATETVQHEPGAGVDLKGFVGFMPMIVVKQ